MNKIEEYLNLASRMYYAGSPIISDETFDKLADSVNYNKVGAKEDGAEKHFFRMYSLQKHYEDQGVAPIDGKLCTVSPKLDGAAISALYINGKLARVLTRGDGVEGRNITEKFLQSNSEILPKSIPDERGIIQITGEIVAPKHIANARNYAAGALNLKSVEEFRSKAISFFAYGITPYVNKTFDQDMQMLSKWGFNTVKDSDIQNIYDTDGLVFRINDNVLFTVEGFTAKHPKGAYALKTRQECVETEIVGVEWNTGRTGRVTPVALLKPVKIGDKEVSRATLNNPGFIEALDIRIGDTVAIRMAGQIIPEIVHKVDG